MTRYLSWENFKDTVIQAGDQRVHIASISPRIEMFSDGEKGRIGIWIELSEADSILPDLENLEFITVRSIQRHSKKTVEMAVSSSALNRQFYLFSIAVCERIIEDRTPVLDAVNVELQAFADLLTEKNHLGIERQIGLLGELLFLQSLIAQYGRAAVDAWVGPQREPHDFRFGSVEFEVKTTLATQRIHFIHGATQAVAGDGRSLYLVSILFGPPGAGEGFSLPSIVASIRDSLGDDHAARAKFASGLKASGLEENQLGLYGRSYTLRRPIATIRVDDSFPAITHDLIAKSLGTMAQRIVGITYEVNVEGLESEEGTAGFSALFPVDLITPMAE